MIKILHIILLLTYYCGIYAQTFLPDTVVGRLKIDSAYNCIQFYSQEQAARFAAHFDGADSDKIVILHFGASHIQAERPTTVTRRLLQNDYSDGGRGMIFNYAAARTYSSANYATSKQGKWTYAKSFLFAPKLPLGVCGMTVETHDKNAALRFAFKEPIPSAEYRILLLFENNASTSGFKLTIDRETYIFTYQQLKALQQNYVEVRYDGEINNISLNILKNSANAVSFCFYGIDVEKSENRGLVYHSLGVGGAPMRSVLNLDRLTEQATLLKPDVALLDFGTNDILYYDSINANLPNEIYQSINKLREVNPDISIIMTSTQDLLRHDRYITAGPKFRDLVDSIARQENVMFWNWYDLSGGFHSIGDWYEAGYAGSDGIHLTHKGYELKGSFLYSSIKNTLAILKECPDMQELTVPSKDYSALIAQQPPPEVHKGGVYKVKAGDTLSAIARKHKTTVKKLKELNHLKSDVIRIGQTIKY